MKGVLERGTRAVGLSGVVLSFWFLTSNVFAVLSGL